VVATVAVGTSPDAIAYDSGKGEIFVSNGDDNTISVISDATNSVVATLPAGTDPYAVAYDSSKGELFIVGAKAATLTIVSDESATSTTSTTSSSLAFQPSYLAIVAVNAAVLLILGALVAGRRNDRKGNPPNPLALMEKRN
jgi:YVTN family beta-propeller protein